MRKHGLGDLQVLTVVGAHELGERRRDARHDRRAAAEPHLEAAHAVALAREEGDVVDPGDRAVLAGAVECGLDLARHQLRRRVAHEVAHVGADVRGGVEDLALADAGQRIGGDVAHRVAAALARGQPDRGDLADQLRHLIQRHVVDLDVLPCRDVRLVQRRVALGDVGERVHLLGVDAAERQLDADHLDVRLTLAVDALLEPEADELVLRRLAVEELGRLGVEVVELALEDRDDVPGDVLDDLGVAQRAGTAGRTRLGGGGFHDGNIQIPVELLPFARREPARRPRCAKPGDHLGCPPADARGGRTQGG